MEGVEGWRVEGWILKVYGKKKKNKKKNNILYFFYNSLQTAMLEGPPPTLLFFYFTILNFIPTGFKECKIHFVYVFHR